MSEAPLKATLKAGSDYDAPWLTVDGLNPEDLKFKLDGIASSGVLTSLVSTAELLRGIHNAAPITQPQQQAPAAPHGWGQPGGAGGSAAPAPQQQQAAPAQPAVMFHPEGEACSCGKVLVFKKVFSKAKQKNFEFWTCPDQRNRDDGHRSEFAN